MSPVLIPRTSSRAVDSMYGTGDTWPTHHAKAKRKRDAKRLRRRVRCTGKQRR